MLTKAAGTQVWRIRAIYKMTIRFDFVIILRYHEHVSCLTHTTKQWSVLSGREYRPWTNLVGGKKPASCRKTMAELPLHFLVGVDLLIVLLLLANADVSWIHFSWAPVSIL
jgi:hypothetical protein